MKKRLTEIRDLMAGKYLSPCESVQLRVKRSDDGVIIELADFDSDIAYEFTVDEKAEVKDFEVVDIPSTMQGDHDAADSTEL